MSILQAETPSMLWRAVIKEAESSCDIALNQQLESYLISLLMRYAERPDLAHQLMAKRFLEAMLAETQGRIVTLQAIGDECLLYAGLFPKSAEKKGVKLAYFVDLGRSAYATVSCSAHDLYWALAYQFIRLMDVLQSIRSEHDLLPFEAYEQWQTLGSKRARQMLETYAQATEESIIAKLPWSPHQGK